MTFRQAPFYPTAFSPRRAKSPTELSQINSLSDFPIPTTIENLIKKKR